MTEPEVAGGHAEFIRAALVRYEAPLVRYALGFTDDLETARDVVQDTFLRLCKQPPDLVEGHLCTTTIIIPRGKNNCRCTEVTRGCPRTPPPPCFS